MTELTFANLRRLSVHKRITSVPTPLTEAQYRVLYDVADALIPEHGDAPRPSQTPDYRQFLDLALAARADSLDVVVGALDGLAAVEPSQLRTALRELAERTDTVEVSDADESRRREPADDGDHSEHSDPFHVLSAVVAGAYFMVPKNKQRIGYPGQGRNVPGPTESVDDLDGDILDAVVERGPIFLSGFGE